MDFRAIRGADIGSNRLARSTWSMCPVHINISSSSVAVGHSNTVEHGEKEMWMLHEETAHQNTIGGTMFLDLQKGVLMLLGLRWLGNLRLWEPELCLYTLIGFCWSQSHGKFSVNPPVANVIHGVSPCLCVTSLLEIPISCSAGVNCQWQSGAVEWGN